MEQGVGYHLAHPMGRLAEVDEIAAAIVALGGSDFSFATGTTVVIDGGWCANGGF